MTLAIAGAPVTLQAQAALKEAVATADGADLARTLGNLPPNLCTPSYLADEARKLAKQFKLGIEVLERKDMERLGMGALLAVTRRLAAAAQADRAALRRRGEIEEAAGAGRQGHHLRHRRHLAQAGRPRWTR